MMKLRTMTFDVKSNWLRCNPVTAARHSQYRLNSFFQDVLISKADPLGETVDYAVGIEFLARGSPHCVLWVKNAPSLVWIAMMMCVHLLTSMCRVQYQLMIAN